MAERLTTTHSTHHDDLMDRVIRRFQVRPLGGSFLQSHALTTTFCCHVSHSCCSLPASPNARPNRRHQREEGTWQAVEQERQNQV
ncbi:hypothetical protein BT67DRAFT_177233 [Trichocladium antarcticum]|uniref:Uncharacterized protein n=1 Tax=Trichocladium antarcticum TaxID=1450529 RepID=A0AAN6ZG92_9PEZI|nr:hypothetical protein BT67DRAFT_177233 [Trichocladium antarcticum]